MSMQRDHGAKRAAEIREALQVAAKRLQLAASRYSPSPPQQARRAVGTALVGTIELLSVLYPDQPSYTRLLNQLLHDLYDLDHGRIAPLLQPVKVAHRAGTALSEELFRAIVAAAMDILIKRKKLKRIVAARDVARRLAKLGVTNASGKPISGSQIAKWREKMMTERASENPAVVRYEQALKLASDEQPLEAVVLILDSLRDLSPANFPKKLTSY